MGNTTLFQNGEHRNVLLEDFSGNDLAVQANQHVVVHGKSGMILDPGGHKVYSRALAATMQVLAGAKLEVLFLSHQDPDIVAATNGWLMTTDANAYVSKLWTRFVPHFGLSHLLETRLLPIPDEGMRLPLGSSEVWILPAHFLHSCGNFHVYDPISKILYTGDLGASLGMDYREVPDFDSHLQYMEGFHRRYMTSKSVMTAWAAMVRSLDIDIIAPQHGAIFKGKELVNRFINWCDGFECGVDLILPKYKIPTS